MLAFGIPDTKAYLGLQRSETLPLYLPVFGQHLPNANLRVQG